MDMSFPLLSNKSGAISKRADFQTLLSNAISRQANSATSRAMLKSTRGPLIQILNSNPIKSRIAFFAQTNKEAKNTLAVKGAFFPRENAVSCQHAKDEHPVYQAGLVNRKPKYILSELSELMTTNPGQENLRNI